MAVTPKYKPIAYRNTSGAGKIKPGKPPKVVAPAKGTVAGAAGGTAPKPKRPPYRPPVGAAPSGDPTLQSIIDSITKPQLAYYQQEQANLDRHHQQAQDAWKQLTGQMLGLLQGVPGQIGSDYDQAIQQTGQLSQAAAQGLVSANPNAQTLANLQAINAPQQQQADVTAHNADVFGGGSGVLNFLGGTVPQQGLVANKAANTGFARTLPFIADENANQQLARLLSTQSGESSAVDQAIAQARSDAQKQAYGILNDYQSQKLAQQRFNADQAYRQQELGLSRARLNQQGRLGYARLNQQGAIAQDRSQQNWTRLSQGDKRIAISQLQNDRNWRLGLARLGVAQGSLALRASQAQAKLNNGGLSVAQQHMLANRAGAIADKAYQGVPTKQNGQTGRLHMSYQEAMREGLAKGIPLTIMQNALNKYWTKPGQFQKWETNPKTGKVNRGGGRPALSYQQRVARGLQPGRPLGVSGDTSSPEARRAISLAQQYLGTPYKWGGASPKTGFDCSGLLQWAWKQAGVSIPRTTYTQWRAGSSVGINELRPGDAVFFVGSDGTASNPGHVGIYIGNGKVLHSPHTGDVIKISALTDLSRQDHYVGARRYA